ncbi:MAG: hypothetical protein ACJ74S_12395 [Gaiellaceae bacterium]
MGPRTLGALAAAAAILLIPSSTGAAPRHGVFQPAKALDGVSLGMSKKQVLEIWGKRHGVCNDCPSDTWYFNYDPFNPQGVGVVFERDRAVHLFTVWRPFGWKTPEGLRLGAPASDVSRIYGSLDRRQCSFYYALLRPTNQAQSVFYIFRDKVWGFGLTRPNASPCL